MKAVASSVFRMMMFPHNGNIFTVDQLTYYDPKYQLKPDNVLPTLEGNQTIFFFTDVCPRFFQDSTVLGAYHGPPSVVLIPSTSNMCTVSSTHNPFDSPPPSTQASSFQPLHESITPFSLVSSWGGCSCLWVSYQSYPLFVSATRCGCNSCNGHLKSSQSNFGDPCVIS